MNYNEFIVKVAEYWGDWENKVVPGVVLAYLKRDIRPDRLPDLLRYMYYTHPHRLGPPGVAEFETAIYRKVEKGKKRDPRKPEMSASMPPPLEEPTEEERAETERLIKEAGGIEKLITGTIKNERIKREKEKADQAKRSGEPFRFGRLGGPGLPPVEADALPPAV